MKQRIGIFLGSTPQQGGIYQYAQSLLEGLSRLNGANYEVIAICTSPRWAEQAVQRNVAAELVSLSRIEQALAALWLHGQLPAGIWRSTLARLQPAFRRASSLNLDLILYPAHDRWSYLWPLPAIASVHDLMHRYERRFPEVGSLYRLREAHHRSIARYCVASLVDSDCGRTQFCESYVADAISVLKLPYIASAQPGSGNDSLPSGIPTSYFFYPAQLWPHKNHRRLIRALAKLSKRQSDVNLVLTGSQSGDYPYLRTLVSELKLDSRVHFLGYVSDAQMQSLYRHARALVMPTFFGPTNIPPLEAFMLDCPVAISGIYGMPEQLGDAALYFDPESEESIADAMEKLWTDEGLRQELISRGRSHADSWNMESFTARLSDCLASAFSLRA